jgi:hypothetical protein
MKLVSEKVNPADIVILTVDEINTADVRNRAGFPEAVQVSTIRDFKGLERRCVILAADRLIADQPELAYVSLSRPRAHLAVVGEAEVLAWIRGPD